MLYSIMGIVAFIDPNDAIGFEVSTAGYPGVVNESDLDISKNAQFLITDENGNPSVQNLDGDFFSTATNLFRATGTIVSVGLDGDFRISPTLDIESGQSGSGIVGPSHIVPIPLEDGAEETALIEVPNPAPSINNPNDLHAANYLGFTSPISMLDGDVEPTVHYSLVPPDEPYNIAFIIDTSASMDIAELEEVKTLTST